MTRYEYKALRARYRAQALADREERRMAQRLAVRRMLLLITAATIGLVALLGAG